MKSNIKITLNAEQEYNKPFPHSCFPSLLFPPRVMIHIVAQCHEEGLEHYLRSYVKVKNLIFNMTQLNIYCRYI